MIPYNETPLARHAREEREKRDKVLAAECRKVRARNLIAWHKHGLCMTALIPGASYAPVTLIHVIPKRPSRLEREETVLRFLLEHPGHHSVVDVSTRTQIEAKSVRSILYALHHEDKVIVKLNPDPGPQDPRMLFAISEQAKEALS